MRFARKCVILPSKSDKMFVGDTGLFITLAFWDKAVTENVIYQKLLSDKLSADLGYVYENVVAQMLKAQASITTSVLGKRSDVAIKRRLRRLEKCNYPYMRSFVIIFILFLASSLKAQTFVKADNDTTVMSEYNDGRIWAYRQIGDFVVGMTNYEEDDDYGKYYQIAIFIKNLGESSITFDPDKVTSSLYTKRGDTLALQVYTFDEYMKKVKNAQAWSMALLGFSAGMNAGMAGYQTTYSTTYGAGSMPYTQVHTTYYK